MATRLLIKRQGDSPEVPPLEDRVFDGDFISLGSDPAASVQLRGAGIAPEHAVIVGPGGQLVLHNGADNTYLNDERLARGAQRPLQHGDRLRLGEYLIVLLVLPSDNGSNGRADVTVPLPPMPRARREEGRPRKYDTSPNVTERTTAGVAPPAAPAAAEPPPKDKFADSLKGLRTEEDSFYFLFEGGTRNRQRITVNGEMQLGWDATGQHIVCEAVVAPRAYVRKDWSGVSVQPYRPGMVVVNGEPLAEPRVLGDGDRMMIAPTAETALYSQAFLVFHVPASWKVLKELVPGELPPPVPLVSPAEMAEKLGQPTEGDPNARALVRQPVNLKPKGRRFGFSPVEITIMAAVTLILAVLVFLFLLYLEVS